MHTSGLSPVCGCSMKLKAEALEYLEQASTKANSRFPEGMTERKASATATASAEADSYGMTARKTKATTIARAWVRW